MKDSKYKGVQIPKDEYNILKEFCDKRSLIMGKFVASLIRENCSLPEDGKILLND